MNTPAHLIIGAAAFSIRGNRAATWAAVIGGFLPDLSLYLLAGVSIFVLGISPQAVFGDLYFSNAWQQVFAIDNSFILWGIALSIAVWRRSAVFIALCGAALLHLALDFPLHGADARMHFWPVTDWKFISTVSYWDPRSGAATVEIIEGALVFALTVLLLLRHTSLWARLGFLALASTQLAPIIMWRLVF